MTSKHIIFAAKPRLSDEEPDLLEQDDIESTYSSSQDGWLPWDSDDLIDIHRIVQERMPRQQKEILEAFLCGMTFVDLGVSEKYYRYWYNKAVEFIKDELKL